MTMKKKLIATLVILIISNATILAQETFKTMFYNVLNFPLQNAAKIDDLGTIVSTYNPDLFMVCELNNIEGADAILNKLQTINSNYQSAQFFTNTSDDQGSNQNDLQNLIYFDSTKFILEAQDIVTTTIRDFNRYTLKLNTTDQDTNPIILEVFVCHLKSSSGGENQAKRAAMIDLLETYLDNPTNGFDEDSHVLLGGDLNVYTNSEAAFVKLTNESDGLKFVDPANAIGSWHNNTNYIDVFTQSTRTQTGQGGATGGFDDRFDFILTSENMDNTSGQNSDLYFVEDSYQVFGNNGNINCYNREINSSDCEDINGLTPPNFNQGIRNILYNVSDHLPVTLELQTSATLLSNKSFTIAKPIAFLNGNIVTNTLEIKINTSDIEELIVYNMLGQNVLNIPVKNQSEVKINISNLANGIFYVTNSNKKNVPLKFVKAN